MLYDMKCTICGYRSEIVVSISKHSDLIEPGWPHPGCVGRMKQIISIPSMIINKESFPGTGNEVQLPTHHGDDMKFRDKSEARDWLGERGLTSKWIENDM